MAIPPPGTKRNPNISEAMRKWNASRTPEQKAASRQKQTDAAVCRMWIPKGPRHGRQTGSKNKVDPNTPIGNTTLANIQKASVKRIIKDLVETQPELIKEAIIAGLLAPPPRSFPYVFLAAQYLDGKPVDAEPVAPGVVDLSNLTRDELMRRALSVARQLQIAAGERADAVRHSDVIDAEVISDEGKSLEQLQDEVRQAELEVRLANEEVERANAVLRITKMVAK